MTTIDGAHDSNAMLGRWSAEQIAAFRKDFCLAPHNLARTGLFTDEMLADLIDRYPRERLQCFTMGTDVERFEQLRPVDTNGVSGKDVIEAIKVGRLWFKLQRIDLWQGPYSELMRDVYGELRELCPRFEPLSYSAVLLLSSPGAVVYFHADANPNMLFHIRGQKRVWLYRNGHEFLIDQPTMEDIFLNYRDEEVPYAAHFEDHATAVDLDQGQVLSWPQNTPHRVTALGPFNASISTFYHTVDSDRRVHVYSANRLLRSTFGLRKLSTKEVGSIPSMKAVLFRAARRFGFVTHSANRAYMTEFRIDPSEVNGVRRLAEPVRTEFR